MLQLNYHPFLKVNIEYGRDGKGVITISTPRIPETLCGVLEKLKGEKVILNLRSGDKEQVKIVDVVGNVLIATTDRRFKFVSCDCICAVIADCLDVISARFDLEY